MIKSNFVADVVELLLDSNADGIASRPQLALITDTLYGYTSGGMFVSFSHPENISAYKSTIDNLTLKGVKITSPGFEFEAEASLYFKKGIIDRMEISCSRDIYPRCELTKYTLVQVWDGGRQLSRE